MLSFWTCNGRIQSKHSMDKRKHTKQVIVSQRVYNAGDRFSLNACRASVQSKHSIVLLVSLQIPFEFNYILLHNVCKKSFFVEKTSYFDWNLVFFSVSVQFICKKSFFIAKTLSVATWCASSDFVSYVT